MEARESVDYRIIETVIRTFILGSFNLFLAYLVAYAPSLDANTKLGITFFTLLLFPIGISWFIKRFAPDRLLIPASNIEAVSLSELALFFPYYTYYISGTLEVSQTFTTWFYAIVMGWLIANALRTSMHSYPIRADQTVQSTATVPLSLDEVSQRIQREAVIQTFGFADSLTDKTHDTVIFRRRKAVGLQLFLRIQGIRVSPSVSPTLATAPSTDTRIDMVGYHQGKYAAFKSDLVDEAVRDKFAYLETILRTGNPNIQLHGAIATDPQKVVDDVILKRRVKEPRAIPRSTIAIVVALVISEVVIPAFFVLRGDLTSALTGASVNTVTLALYVHQVLSQRAKSKEKSD